MYTMRELSTDQYAHVRPKSADHGLQTSNGFVSTTTVPASALTSHSTTSLPPQSPSSSHSLVKLISKHGKNFLINLTKISPSSKIGVLTKVSRGIGIYTSDGNLRACNRWNLESRPTDVFYPLCHATSISLITEMYSSSKSHRVVYKVS